jgi:hypothetical protein
VTSKNWVEVVIATENNLGWLPKGNVHRARAREASKLSKAAESNVKVTPANLDLTIAMLRKRKQPVKTPYGLVFHIDEALEMAYIPPPVTDLAAAVRAALDAEHARGDVHSPEWIGRLVRAQGSGRQAALDAWKAAGRG